MQLKDHYRILELEPSATLAEIKKAYRRLAQVYHPDKNNNDPYAAAQFSAVKEAYETLSNTSRKAYYLQQRWYHQSTGSRRTKAVITPVSVLKQSLELNKYVSGLDVHRMDKEGLYHYISEILSDETIEELRKFDEPAIKKEIIGSLLRTVHPLSFGQATGLADRFKRLSSDTAMINTVDLYIRQLSRRHRWEKYMPWILLTITVGICLLIFLLNKPE